MSNQSSVKLLDTLSYVFILLSVAAVPLVVDTSVLNFFVLPKQYLFMGLLFFNILFFAVKTVLSRRLHYRQSFLDVPLLIFLVAALLSSLFSENLLSSFLGRNDYYSNNFIFLFFLAMFYFVFVNTVVNKDKWQLILHFLLGVGGLTSILFILKTVFGLNLPLIGAAVNTVDGFNSAFGIWLVVMAILSAGLLMKKGVGVNKALFYFFILILSVVPILIIGFKLLWWIMAIALLLLLLVGVSFIKDTRSSWLSGLFALLVLSGVFVVFGSPRFLQTRLPVEVALGLKPSWTITSKAVFSGAKNFAIGSGLGTFGTDFSKYRTAEFNNDPVAWSLRFNRPFNHYLAFIAEGGILLTLSLLFILLFTLGHVFQAWFSKREQKLAADKAEAGQASNKLDIFVLLVAWLVVWMGMAVNFFGPALWHLWWLLLALLVTRLSWQSRKVIKERSWVLEDSPQYNLAFSFSLIVVVVLVILVGAVGARFYWAEVTYAKAIKETDPQAADQALSRVVGLRGNYDLYHIARARSYLAQAANLTRAQNPDLQGAALMVKNAVDEALLASKLSPNTVAIWENLATMYENASLLVPQAGPWAIKSLDRAIELEPTNAFLHWRLGNNYARSQDLPKAIDNFKRAVELKPDYAGAYVSLAGAYEQNNQSDLAVENYQKLFGLPVPKTPQMLFNLGRLMYNRNQGNDRDEAEKLWIAAIQAQPEYANALYSLGLLYESRNDPAQALQYYYKVKDLNPNNQDVVDKITSLVGGSASSLSDVSDETPPAEF